MQSTSQPASQATPYGTTVFSVWELVRFFYFLFFTLRMVLGASIAFFLEPHFGECCAMGTHQHHSHTYEHEYGFILYTHWKNKFHLILL